jgi:hypothetical protein
VTEKSGDALRATGVVRVGFVGHRWSGDSDIDLQFLERRVEAVIEEIETAARSLSTAPQSNDSIEFRLITGLAEGADQLVSDRALQKGWQIQALLPFAVEEVVEDFTHAEAQGRFESLIQQADGVVRFNYAREPHTAQGHRAVGEYLLRSSDLLVAVWDGQPSRGVGGTAWSLERAAELGIPLVCIRIDRTDYPVTVLPVAPKSDSDSRPEAWGDELSAALRGLLPALQLSPDLSERKKRFNPGLAYPLFQLIFCGRKLRLSDILPRSGVGNRTWSHADPVSEQQARADAEANYYAQVYRSAVVLNYLFAALAVLMALMGLLIPEGKLVWICIELFLIIAVIINTNQGQKRHWHRRWLDYRQLAEYGRVFQLAAAAGCGFSPRVLGRENPVGVGRSAWVSSMIDAASRQLRPVSVDFSKGFVSDCKDRLLDYVSGQIEYHERTARISESMNHRLHVLGQVCLAGTILSCLFFLGAYAWMDGAPDAVTKTVTFLTAALPAFGASAFGLRAHLDLRGVARRSESTARALARLEREIASMSPTPLVLMNMLDALFENHGGEVRDWRLTFEERHLEIPA